MSSRRERRQKKNQNPLIEIKDYFEPENVSKLKGKKNIKKNSTTQSKRQPLGELVSNSSCGLPEIPVKLTESGCLEVDKAIKTAENGVQTEHVTCEDKYVQTQVPMEQSIHYRMCADEEPPVEYWKILAEQRRLALIETLKENEELYDEIDKLKSQIVDQNNHREQANYFSFMYKLSTDNN